jgi:peptidoglycan biosynthesis protein MviN/MurJ (putative lipid II flippase)
MVGVLYWLTPAAEAWLATTVAERTLWIARSVIVGGLVYLATVWLLGWRLSHLRHRA